MIQSRIKIYILCYSIKVGAANFYNDTNKAVCFFVFQLKKTNHTKSNCYNNIVIYIYIHFFLYLVSNKHFYCSGGKKAMAKMETRIRELESELDAENR